MLQNFEYPGGTRAAPQNGILAWPGAKRDPSKPPRNYKIWSPGYVNFGEKSSRQRGRAGCRGTVRVSIFANAHPNQETSGVLLRVCVRFALRKSPLTICTGPRIQLMYYRSKVRARRRRAHFFRFLSFRMFEPPRATAPCVITSMTMKIYETYGYYM